MRMHSICYGNSKLGVTKSPPRSLIPHLAKPTLIFGNVVVTGIEEFAMDKA